MTYWRDRILNEFTPDITRLTLVADPDGLLLEENIFAGIKERGFELLLFEDHIALRYAYETRFRSRWDQGEQADLVLVFQSAISDLDTLPYDLLQAGRRLSFSLGDIFPNLSYSVVSVLRPEYLDALYDAQQQHLSGVLGANDSKDFILRHVFDIVPELIREASDLLRVLLRRHYRGQHVPSFFDDRLVQLLRRRVNFEDWPLEIIVPDRQAFFAFLQERWPIFLDTSMEKRGAAISYGESSYDLKIPGIAEVPFNHDDVRVYIDNLFLEGLLEPVSIEQVETVSESWFAVGIRRDEQADRIRRIEGLLKTITSNIPHADSQHHDWQHCAITWAELLSLALQSDVPLPDTVRKQIEVVQTQIDTAFLPWLLNRYVRLANLPPVPPVMLHHIPRFLAREIQDDRKQRMAFILMDGLSLDQWVVMRGQLARQRPAYHFHERAVFAWIPTITSVSRQTAFSGMIPAYFPDSIRTTDKEPALWARFWQEQGLRKREVSYAKGLGDRLPDSVVEIIVRQETRVVGLVVDKVDKIMHGMELGTTGMHNQIKQWASQPFMVELFDLLMNNRFQIYLSSDHGNIEAAGCGRPAEGAVADLRGERVRVYSDPLLRNQVKAQFADALEWSSSIGLPDNYLPLLAPVRSAFVRESDRLVCHGGVALEEVIVPFVQIGRDKS